MALRDLFVRIKGDNTGAKKALKETEQDVKGLSGKMGDLKGTFMAAAAAGAAAFAVLINWAKDTDFGLQAINKTLAVGKQLLTDLMLRQGSHLKEAAKIADRQSKINQDDIREGYIVKTMQSELAQLITASADQTKSHAEKQEILNKAIEKEKELKAFLLADAKEELAVAWDNWRLNLQSIDAKKKYYEIAGRIRDIEGSDSRRLQSQFTAELVAQKKRAEELVDAFTEIPPTLDEIKKKAGEITKIMTGEIGATPGASVFAPKTPFSLTNNKGKLAGAPVQYAGTSAVALQMAADLQDALNSDAVMQASEAFAKDWQKTWEGVIKEVTNFLADSFISVFEGLGEGNMEGLGKNMLGSMGRLVADLGKMLVALGLTWLKALELIKVPTIHSAIAAIAAGGAAMAIGGLMVGASKKASESMQTGSGASSSGQGSINLQNIKIQFNGKLKGKDIYFSGMRYVEELNRGT